MLTVTLEEARFLGEKVLTAFQQIRTHYYATKDALIKSHGFHLLTRQSEEERQVFAVSQELSLETILSVLDRER